MRRGCAGLIAAVLALTGCKSTDPKPTDKDTAGTPASRAKNDGKGPSWLEPADNRPGSDRADSGDPKNVGKDCVGGRVLDPSNRPVANVYIQVEAVNPPPGSPAPVGISTDQNGAFYTRGLRPGRAYNLTAEATLNGKPYTASVQTSIPNTNITLVLRDDPGLPPVVILKGPSGGSSFPPPPSPFEQGNDRIPPMSLGRPAPRSNDEAWTPGTDASKPVPAAIPPSSPRAPSLPSGTIPPPDDLTAPFKPPIRPENVADRPAPWSAPPANIPAGPPTMPPYPTNPVPQPSSPDPMKMGMSGNGFILVDTQGRSFEFPANKSGSVVLVEFMTTTCPHSKRSIPVLAEFQARYATAGLQVIAVACDTEEDPKKTPINQKQRMEAAANYIRDNSLNYQVFVEPGAEAGGVRNRYNVTHYPTAVLLDGTGAVLWQGHPTQKAAELEAAIKKALGK
jgi:thiol-disulfide isomerase/thioredoxin